MYGCMMYEKRAIALCYGSLSLFMCSIYLRVLPPDREPPPDTEPLELPPDTELLELPPLYDELLPDETEDEPLETDDELRPETADELRLTDELERVDDCMLLLDEVLAARETPLLWLRLVLVLTVERLDVPDAERLTEEPVLRPVEDTAVVEVRRVVVAVVAAERAAVPVVAEREVVVAVRVAEPVAERVAVPVVAAEREVEPAVAEREVDVAAAERELVDALFTRVARAPYELSKVLLLAPLTVLASRVLR